LFAVITLLAVAFTALVVWQRVRRDRYTAGLAPEYSAAYEAVSDRLAVSPLSRVQHREVLSDVLELLYHAQETGRPATDIVGDDVGAFVERVQESHGYRGTLGFHLLGGVQCLSWLLPFLQLVNWVAHPEADSYFDATMGIAMVPFIALVAFVVMPLTQTALARNRIGPLVLFPLGIAVLFILCLEVGHRYGWHLPWVRTFLDGEVAVVGSWGIALLWGAAVAAAAVGKWWLRRRALSRV